MPSAPKKGTIVLNMVAKDDSIKPGSALFASGYRAGRMSHHYRVIQSLEYTIGADTGTIAQLDHFRKKRNISDYERSGVASEQEASEMHELAKKI